MVLRTPGTQPPSLSPLWPSLLDVGVAVTLVLARAALSSA